jgi:hypothetical protein
LDGFVRVIKSAQDALGCIFSVLAPPVIFIGLFIGYLKLSSLFFPEDPNKRIEQCEKQKQYFQRSAVCEPVYDIGDAFIREPNRIYSCSNSELLQRVKSHSIVFRFNLNKCSEKDANNYSEYIVKNLSRNQAGVFQCAKHFDGRDLIPPVQKKYDAFLACRSHWWASQ